MIKHYIKWVLCNKLLGRHLRTCLSHVQDLLVPSLGNVAITLNQPL